MIGAWGERLKGADNVGSVIGRGEWVNVLGVNVLECSVRGKCSVS